MKLADKLAQAANHPPTLRRRILAKVLPVFVYSTFFPALLFITPKLVLDRWLHLPTFLNPITRALLGGSFIAPGILFLFWSIQAQRVIGQGTPMPLMATQKLIVQKPYSYSRNPLFFGLIILFFGISILLGSISSLVMVLTFSVIILLYVKFIEEKELENRFREAYLAYKKTTPFLIPHPSLSRGNNPGEIL
ncbi:MAG: isoprenylcysteine carboxylmethyltransferase family protein [Anaerolineales bacterium]|nr:isoprenylcysteine carboxylmethyltransferase family protein [Anaerolineales bacterium]